MAAHVTAPSKFGSFHGQDVLECELHSDSGVVIKVLNYGAIVRDWQVPVNGQKRSVVLGFDHFDDYVKHGSAFLGTIVGRVANRIGGAVFSVDGKQYKLEANEGRNHLHGGATTFAKKIWRMEPLTSATHPSVRLTLDSPDGEGGYPGNMQASVTYRLEGNSLRIEFEATCDAACPVNMVQHNYFNLVGHGDVREHTLWLSADQFTPFTSDQVPTGEIKSVAGTELDFWKPKVLRDVSLDNNFVLNSGDRTREPVAVLRAPDQSLTLRLWTDQPGLQVYTAGGLQLPDPGLHGTHYPRFGAICLEDQNFPDAINQAKFPDPVLRPGQTYRHWCEIAIAPPEGMHGEVDH